MNIPELAQELLNCVVLVLSDSRSGSQIEFRLTEIEFYLFSDSHPDPYTHRSPEQKLSNRFYFHKFANGTYKSGTWKGLDICFGSESSYFGVLIRSLVNTTTNQFIEGPCLSVNTILNHFSCKDVKELASKVFGEKLDFDIFDDRKPVHLRLVDHLKEEILFRGPRIGLSNKWPEYRDLPYRYCIFRDKIKKQKRDLKQVETTDI